MQPPRCIICRQPGEEVQKKCSRRNHKSFRHQQSEDLNAWTQRCVKTICALFGIPRTHPFQELLSRANFCSKCLDVLRDVDFTVKQLESLLSRLKDQRKTVLRNLEKNYENIPDRESYPITYQDVENPEANSVAVDYNELVKILFEKITDTSTDKDFFTQLLSVLERRSRNPKPVEMKMPVIEVFESSLNEYDAGSEGLTGRKSRRKRAKKSEMESDVSLDEDEEESDSAFQFALSPLNDDDDEMGVNNSDEEVIVKSTPRSERNPSSRNRQVADDADLDNSEGETEGSTPKKVNKNTIEDQNQNDGESVKKKFNTTKFIACNICKIGFPNKFRLLIHKRKVHEGDPTPHWCKTCPKKFKCLKSLQNHNAKHNEHKISCSICNKLFLNKDNLQKHLNKTHHKDKKTCCFCEMKVDTDELLLEHENLHRSNPQPFTCTICQAVFTNSRGLINHVKLIHQDKFHICGVCGVKISTLKNLEHHMKLRHDDSWEGFRCKVCNHKFISQGVLERHMWKHSDVKSFVCDQCGLAFKYPSGLKRHYRMHEGDYRCECKICGKKFVAPQFLDRHEEIHSKTLTYECPICHKRFQAKQNLNQHVRIHGPNNPNKKKRVRNRPSERKTARKPREDPDVESDETSSDEDDLNEADNSGSQLSQPSTASTSNFVTHQPMLRGYYPQDSNYTVIHINQLGQPSHSQSQSNFYMQ